MPEQNQDQNQNSDDQNNQDQLDTIQPTNPPEPTTPAVDNTALETVRNVFHGALQDANARADRLARELEEERQRRNTTPNQPNNNPEEDVRLLTENPRELIRQTLREEMETQLRPLREEAGQFSRARQIDDLKRQLRNDPSVKYLHIQQVEAGLDNLLGQAPQLNYGIAQMLYNTAVGWYVSNGGSLSTEAPVTPPNVHSTSVPTPPNPRPAPPVTPPRNNNNQPKKQYTENEKLLMRINHMSEEEYEKWLNMPPQQVATAE